MDAPWTAGVRQPVEDGAVANQQQHTIRVAVATRKFSHQVWWSRYQEGNLARTARLFGLRGEYSPVTGDSWWSSAVARRLGGVFDKSLGGLTWSGAFRSTGVKAVVMGQTRPSGRLYCGGESCTSPFQQASLLVARAPHSGDWLLALPITDCGLRLEDEAVRITVALRQGSELGSSHTCRCGSLVGATGVHGLVCKQAPAEL